MEYLHYNKPKKKIAFICVHNSCRSQIAEALGKHLASDVFESYSAGTETKPQINPDAVRIMKEMYDIDMEATQYSKLMSDIPEPDITISMGCNVGCPLIGREFDDNWGLEDPTGKSDEEFVRVIKEIESKILQLIKTMNISIRPVVIDDYDGIFELWNSTEQSRRAMNPVDDSRDGIWRYLKRNPTTCFLAYVKDDIEKDNKIVGVILTGHDGRRGMVHHMCVHPDYRRQGIARMLVQTAEDALSKEGITKVFGLVFKDNNIANDFWEEQGYTLRTNLNYRNKSLNENIPQGE